MNAARPEGPVRGTWLVARREIAERMGTKSFYVSTALLVLLILGIGTANRLIGDDGPGAVEVGISSTTADGLGEAIEQTAAAAEREAAATSFADDGAAMSALADDEVDLVVLSDQRRVVFADSVDEEVLAIVRQAVAGLATERSLLEAGLDRDRIAQALSTTPLTASTLDGDGGEESGLEILVGTGAGVLLFAFIQMFGSYVLTGVVEEKSSGVVELVLVRVRPAQLLAGKVAGIGVAALAQFLLAVGATLLALFISGVSVPGQIWAAVPTSLLWFLGGYALYATMYALAGSLVSRQEDAQAAATPITTILIGSYLAIFLFGYAPDSTAATVMSMIPPITPFLMPMRMASGSASAVEVVAAGLLLAATVVVGWRLAGRIFEQVLLRRGTRVAWRDAGALLRGHAA